MNPINPMKLLQLKASWEQFKMRHPKFPPFLAATARSGIAEGTLLEISVTTADGRKFSSNLRLTAEDMQLVNELKEVMGTGV